MKKGLLTLLAFYFVLSLTAQDTAMDWTRTECGTTTEHHLFTELESGYVIIIDFVMMNCPTCVYATGRINELLAPFEAEYPGKVRFYSVGFNDLTTCSQMLSWRTYNHYKHPVFEKGADETNYYGGMGMPTVVVLGGLSAHKVYYNHFGYAASEDPIIEAAINLALAESNVSGTSNPAGIDRLNVFPNPFTGQLSLDLKGMAVTHVVISDMLGRELYRQNLESNNEQASLDFPTLNLPAGIIFVSLYNGPQLIAINKAVRE